MIDATYIMELLILTIVVFFFLGYLLGKYKSGFFEHQGEQAIRELLSENFATDEFHLLNNITLSYKNSTTQIDHVLVSTRGIFVIETKHYSGWIFGNKKSKNWTQVLYRKKFQLQNPLRQNYKHVMALKQLLDFLPEESFHNVVVFTGSAEFKTEVPENVFGPMELVDYIEAKTDDVLSLNRVAFSVGRIECARYQISKETDIEHVHNLNKN